jgi:hypothetical protein
LKKTVDGNNNMRYNIINNLGWVCNAPPIYGGSFAPSAKMLINLIQEETKMTDVAVMKRSNLIVPEGFVEISKEEMCYVEGGISISSSGIYFSANEVYNICGGAVSWAAAGYASTFLSLIPAMAWAAIGWIPIIGQAIASALTVYIFANLSTIAWAFVDGTLKNKGIELYITTKWFVPYVAHRLK